MNAKEFAIQAHGSQLRKYTGEPYHTHLAEVAGLVAAVPHTQAMLDAAWLHDVVEDTNATLGDVRAIFGSEVGDLVWMLTDVSKPSDGNRAARKALDRKHLANASPDAQTIKLADLISNSVCITCHDKNFARVYMAEKALLLEMLTLGDPKLLKIARMMCELWQMLHGSRA